MENDTFKDIYLGVYDLWTNEQEVKSGYTETMMFRNMSNSNYMFFIFFINFAIAATNTEVKLNSTPPSLPACFPSLL